MYNAKLYEAGRKRRRHLLKLHEAGTTVAELSRKNKVSEQRMRWMLAKAREEK
jgi:lambda repressor-like predicted transcriptional regulator